MGCPWKCSQRRGSDGQQLSHTKTWRERLVPSLFAEQPLQLSGQDGNYDGFRLQRSNPGDGAEPLDDGSPRSHPALHQHSICLGCRAGTTWGKS